MISCGIGFPHDAATLALLEKAEVLYGSRTLLERCPISGAERRVIGAQARRDASDALAAARAGRRVVALASGDALYHGFGGTLHALAGPEDAITYHPGITAFQAFFHRIGQPWDEARLFSAHGGEAVPAREIAESRLAVAYGGSRHNAADIARAVLDFHPGAARRRAIIAERLGSPDERIIAGTLEDAARLHCGPTSILALFPDTCEEETPLDTQTGPASRLAEEAAPAISGASPACGNGRRTDAGGLSPASSLSPQAAPILPLGLPEED
ncbi:MAG: precorrin-6y C5,15-methyltransferase (decarboxylating) subunit CbiE [Bilophila sp.]